MPREQMWWFTEGPAYSETQFKWEQFTSGFGGTLVNINWPADIEEYFFFLEEYFLGIAKCIPQSRKAVEGQDLSG